MTPTGKISLTLQSLNCKELRKARGEVNNINTLEKEGMADIKLDSV